MRIGLPVAQSLASDTEYESDKQSQWISLLRCRCQVQIEIDQFNARWSQHQSMSVSIGTNNALSKAHIFRVEFCLNGRVLSSVRQYVPGSEIPCVTIAAHKLSKDRLSQCICLHSMLTACVSDEMWWQT